MNKQQSNEVRDLCLACEGADANAGGCGHWEGLLRCEDLDFVLLVGKAKDRREKGVGTAASHTFPSLGKCRGDPKPSVAVGPPPRSRV
jgi:hypothetical protein